MRPRGYLLDALIKGVIVVVPAYLALLLLLKGMQSLVGLVKPVARLLPSWLPGENLLALLLILVICLLVGMAVKTRVGRRARERLDVSLFERIPGYALIRSLTQRLAGDDRETAWQPALAEIEEALVPAFIIETLDDGRLTVFVPSVPTPFAGAVYILTPDRVHPVNVSFAVALRSISRWGSGAKDLVKGMQPHPSTLAR
jgi:uncharacterized membrane protein